jgi:hypothetical protein
LVEAGRFINELDKIRRINPRIICSAHLPPASGKTEHLLGLLENLPASTPFVTPDQTALEQILAQIKDGN